jgi:hypothetical protein
MMTSRTPKDLSRISAGNTFGGSRLPDPLETSDGTLLVASLDDLMATKLALLDRAEVKDYHDIAMMISAGVSCRPA